MQTPSCLARSDDSGQSLDRRAQLPGVHLLQLNCDRDIEQSGLGFLTQPVRDPASLAGKKEWKHEHYPGIPFLIGDQKRLVSAPGFVLVDDHFKNVEDWRDGGGDAILVPGPWNPLRGQVTDEGVVPHVERCLDAIIDQRKECGW